MIISGDFLSWWHRAAEMSLVEKYFSGLSPVKDKMLVATDVADVINIVESSDSPLSMRIVAPITERCPEQIERVDLENSRLVEYFKLAKSRNPSCGILLFQTKETSRRDERMAGISILAEIDKKLTIEAVGKGFDGREVSKGICCHERYEIPWLDLYDVDCASKLYRYRTFLTDQEHYTKTRNERINFLSNCGLEDCEKNIPITYSPIPSAVWDDITGPCFYCLLENADIFKNIGFELVHLSGHIEINTKGSPKFRVWSMSHH